MNCWPGRRRRAGCAPRRRPGSRSRRSTGRARPGREQDQADEGDQRRRAPAPATTPARPGAARPGRRDLAGRAGRSRRSQLHQPRAADQGDEERCADQRHHDADLKLARPHEQPAERRRREQQQAADQRRSTGSASGSRRRRRAGRHGGRPGRRRRSVRRRQWRAPVEQHHGADADGLMRPAGSWPSERATSSPSWSRLRRGRHRGEQQADRDEREHLPEHVHAATGDRADHPEAVVVESVAVAQHDGWVNASSSAITAAPASTRESGSGPPPVEPIAKTAMPRCRRRPWRTTRSRLRSVMPNDVDAEHHRERRTRLTPSRPGSASGLRV